MSAPRDRSTQFETRYLTIFAGVTWRSLSIGLTVEWDNEDRSSVAWAIRLGPFYFGMRLTP